MDVGEQIKKARKNAGHTQKSLAKLIGVPPTTLASWEQGGSKPNIPTLIILSRTLGVSFGDRSFLEESEGWDGPPIRKRMIPVVGYVGAGGHINPLDDHASGAGLDEIDAPPTTARGTVAVIVRGDSMYPMFIDKMVLFYSERHDNVSDYIHRVVIAHFEDGRKAVKTLTMGSEKGLYTLISFNAPPITDVKLNSVSIIDWIKPL